MKLKTIALALLLAAGLAFAPTAWAEDEEGGDLKKRIKKKMERILELMKKNESALLELSTGAQAETKKIDVPVPEGDAGKSSGGDGAGEGSAAEGSAAEGKDGKGSTGAKAAEELGRLVTGHRKDGGVIPAELRELVEMIPL